MDHKLKNKDIERIKQEELLRLRLRNELEIKKKESNGLLNFLNSPFALFIFSALFITGLGNFLSQKIQEKKETIELNKEKIKHMIEIDNRISEMKFLIYRLERDSTDLGIPVMLGDVIIGGNYYRPSLDEFKNLQLVGLIAWFKYNTKGYSHLEDAYQTSMTFKYFRDKRWKYDIPKTKKAVNHLEIFLSELKSSGNNESYF
jgi:hypothetical protein